MATNEVKTKFGTTTTWTDTGGDKLLDLGGLTTTSLKMGAYLDLGVSPRPMLYEWELFIDGFDSAPVVGEVIELRFSQSNATTGFDGSPTTDPTSSAQGTITSGQAKNCVFAGRVRCASTTAGDNLKARGFIEFSGRYIAPVIENLTTKTLLSTSDAHTLKLTPITPDIQASA